MLNWCKNQEPPPGNGPDYSHVSSKDVADELVSRGELTKIYLLPTLFGGTDDPRNVVYVPPFVAEIKCGTDENTIGPLAMEGRVSRYSAMPKYQGKSFVPCKIEVHASDPADFRAEICIWGDGLKGDSDVA